MCTLDLGVRMSQVPLHHKETNQAFNAFLLACYPRLRWGQFEEIVKFAIEVGLEIEGKKVLTEDSLKAYLLRTFTRDPRFFRYRFQKIYQSLAPLSVGTAFGDAFPAPTLATPDTLRVSVAALKFRLKSLHGGMDWQAYQRVVRDSIDLSINKDPGLGSKFSKRMDYFLRTYMSNSRNFDTEFSWLRVQVQFRIDRPDEFPRLSHTRREYAAEKNLRQRLLQMSISDEYDRHFENHASLNQRNFQSQLRELYGLEIGDLLRKSPLDHSSRVTAIVTLYDLFNAGILDCAGAVLAKIQGQGLPSQDGSAAEPRRAHAGDPWDDASHWGWYL